MDDEPDRPDEEWVWDTQILVCRGLHDGQAPEARDVWEHRDQIQVEAHNGHILEEEVHDVCTWEDDVPDGHIYMQNLTNNLVTNFHFLIN